MFPECICYCLVVVWNKKGKLGTGVFETGSMHVVLAGGVRYRHTHWTERHNSDATSTTLSGACTELHALCIAIFFLLPTWASFHRPLHSMHFPSLSHPLPLCTLHVVYFVRHTTFSPFKVSSSLFNDVAPSLFVQLRFVFSFLSFALVPIGQKFDRLYSTAGVGSLSIIYFFLEMFASLFLAQISSIFVSF